MIKQGIMALNKSAVELKKPSGTIAIKANFTAVQRKLYDGFLYVAQEILKKNPKVEHFEVSLPEITRFFEINIKGKKDLNNIKEQIYDLMRIIIEYNILGKDRDIEGKATALNNIEFHVFKKKEGTIIKFSIPYRVKQAFINKNSLFAIIDLVVIKNLKSKYAIILYELIRDYKGAEIPEMSIEDFRKLFGIENKYKTMPLVKQWVLNPAVKEINNNPHIDWEVSYKIFKQSNINKSIKFYIKRKPKVKQLEQKAQELKENAKIEVLLALIPEEYRTNGLKRYLSDAVEKYDIGYLEAQISLVNKRGPDDYIAYLKSAIKEDYAGYYELQEQKEEYQEMLDKYFERAKKIIEIRGLNRDIKELTKELIYIDFNRDKITEEMKNKLFELI